MDGKDIRLQVLPAYQLRLCFPNGSEAIVDLKQRVHAMRFGQLATPELFQTAKVVGDEVVWNNGSHCVRASINELLDSMQMD